MISITEVDTSPDLRLAKVYFSVYGDEAEIAAALAHLNRASGFLHRNLKGRLDLRHTPHLEFVLDRSLARGDRIMRLMRTIEEEREHREEP
jgi:ribosome-binding factor A